VNPHGGGPIEGIKQLASVYRSKGILVEIASLDPPDSKFLKDIPIKVHALGPGRLGYRYSPRFVPWLRGNAHAYDIVIVNGIWQYHSFGTWRALRDSSTPYVVFTHGMLDPWFKRKYPFKHFKKWLYWPWAEYRVLRDARAVLFTCEEERRLARKSFPLYSARETVVNYGTASPKDDQDGQTECFFARFPHLRRKRLVLFLGRIHPKKGCDLAIRAFAGVLARDPEWHLVMAGPDQIGWRESLERLADHLGLSGRLTWMGMITGEAKLGALRSAEVFLLPSHQENFGIVVAEALACGTPALISTEVNIWREVQDSGAGIVATDDIDGTCSLLRTWVEMSETGRTAMRQAARTCFSTKFEIHKSAASLIKVLRHVTAISNERSGVRA
jgi:glycosyltransferase involved in cell wall biosynthesis